VHNVRAYRRGTLDPLGRSAASPMSSFSGARVHRPGASRRAAPGASTFRSISAQTRGSDDCEVLLSPDELASR
jgi:hypothetical protein